MESRWSSARTSAEQAAAGRRSCDQAFTSGRSGRQVTFLWKVMLAPIGLFHNNSLTLDSQRQSFPFLFSTALTPCTLTISLTFQVSWNATLTTTSQTLRYLSVSTSRCHQIFSRHSHLKSVSYYHRNVRRHHTLLDYSPRYCLFVLIDHFSLFSHSLDPMALLPLFPPISPFSYSPLLPSFASNSPSPPLPSPIPPSPPFSLLTLSLSSTSSTFSSSSIPTQYLPLSLLLTTTFTILFFNEKIFKFR